MNEDDFVLLLILLLPMLSGVLTVIIVLVAWRANSREGPHCFRRISKGVLEQAIPCPECGVLHSDIHIVSSQIVDSKCSNCKQEIIGGDSVRLWDAKTYCVACITKQSHHLLQICDEPQLAEVTPHSAWKLSVNMFFFLTFGVFCFATVVSVPLALIGKFLLAAQGFGVIFLIGTPVILLFTVGAGLAFAFVRPKTYVWNGKLIVRLGAKMIVAPLAECTWAKGRASELTVLPYGFLFRGPAIIIDLPKQPGPQGNRLTVGLTPATFKAWESFLSLAAIPPISEKKTWWHDLLGKKTSNDVD